VHDPIEASFGGSARRASATRVDGDAYLAPVRFLGNGR
jgi:hypothetical protein